MRRLLPLLCLTACSSPTPSPGDLQMGAFVFTAEPFAENAETCKLSGILDGGFTFQASFSRKSDGGVAFVTINNISHDATWDGQLLDSTYGAAREFPADCSKCKTQLNERFHIALLSSSQNQVAGGRCPDAPLDGGVPPADPDAGVTLPSGSGASFDAVRACGELSDTTSSDPAPDTASDADGGCRLSCNGCVLRYRLFGERR